MSDNSNCEKDKTFSMIKILIMMVLFHKIQKNRNNNYYTQSENDKPYKLQKHIDFQRAFKITFINVLVNIVKNTDLIENNKASVQFKKETIKCKDSETYH